MEKILLHKPVTVLLLLFICFIHMMKYVNCSILCWGKTSITNTSVKCNVVQYCHVLDKYLAILGLAKTCSFSDDILEQKMDSCVKVGDQRQDHSGKRKMFSNTTIAQRDPTRSH